MEEKGKKSLALASSLRFHNMSMAGAADSSLPPSHSSTVADF